MPDTGSTTQTFTSADEIESIPLRFFPPGTQLANRYEIRRVVDWGGSAIVYAAYDRDLRRDIALKVLRHDRVTDAVLRRFRREVAVARDASSPHLVRIFDIATSDGAIYLTMELVDGGSLRKRLAGTPLLPIEEVIRVASAIAEALDALHTPGIVHRDVKPGNVLLENNGGIKLGDFGLARYVASESVHASSAGAIVGTLAYLSPEQALGVHVDHRSDLYALGVVIFEMLTGTSPFHSRSELGGLLARMKSAAIDVRPLRADCPPWLARLVTRLLERHPRDRYQSARAIVEDLRRHKTRSPKRRWWSMLLVAGNQ